VKCLEPDRVKRYQSVTDILNDLETFDPSKKVGAGVRVKSRLKRNKALVAVAAAVVVLPIVIYVLRNRFVLAPPAAHANVAVFIADFSNRTGDPSFDNALEGVTKLALEQAAFISAFDSGQAGNLGVQPDDVDKDNADGVSLSDGIDEAGSPKNRDRPGNWLLRFRIRGAAGLPICDRHESKGSGFGQNALRRQGHCSEQG
jgi:hypothetical protein